MANLMQYDLVDPICRSIRSGKPFLGICLGLQLLFTHSEEFGFHRGMDVISGTVKRFPFNGRVQPVSPRTEDLTLKVPHIGWNALTVQREAPPLRGIEPQSQVYFVHSYYVEPTDPSVTCTVTEYGIPFVSSVWRENVFACQFHPEKSQSVGLQIIRNFAEWR
jgi:glutamine amidotransferase